MLNERANVASALKTKIVISHKGMSHSSPFAFVSVVITLHVSVVAPDHM